MVLYTENGKEVFDGRLLSFIQKKNYDDVLAIIEDVDVKNLVDSEGMTLLHHATNADYCRTVKYLIQKKECKVDILDINGNTPLMNAMRCKHLSTIKFLIGANADILLCGPGKDNPLKMIFAPEYSILIGNTVHEKFFDILIRKFAPDSQQIARILMDVKCPLPRAMYFEDVLITEYILDAGCDINDPDPDNGRTALHNAVKYMDLLNLNLLLERGADISAKDKRERTPSYYYVPGREESKSVLVALLRHDTLLSPATTKGYLFVEKVLENGYSDEVEILLSRGFSLEDNTWNNEASTLLHAIAGNIHSGVIEQLEGMKFDVHARDIGGNTALFDAAYSNNPSSLEFLLKHGANPNDENNHGETSFIYGFEEWTWNDSESSAIDQLKCVEIFLEYGADVLRSGEDDDTIFDIFDPDEQFALIQPLISQVAILEATCQPITKNIFEELENNKRYREYFALCRSEIEKLKETMINKTVCLFQFWTESENKLLGYVRDCESAEKLEKIISEMHNLDIFFIKRLRKRVQGILETAKLRENAALIIARLSGCNNLDVVERIILFLDKESLQNLCKVDAVSINAVD